MNDQDKKLSRRDMLFGGLRYAALTAIGAGGAATALKRRKLLREGKCLNNGVCPQCDVFSECGLPQARALTCISHKPKENTISNGFSN